MTAVILASESTDLIRRVRLATDDDLLVLTRDQVPSGPAQLLALVDSPDDVRAVLLDTVGHADLESRAVDLATRMDQSFPNVSMLLVSDRAEELGLVALRSGIRDLVEPGSSVEDLRWAIRRATELGAHRSPAAATQDLFTGRVITVAAPKGGVGKTTIATNLAVALTGQSPQGTVLIDLDVQFGDVAAALDLDPTYTLADVVSGPVAADSIALKSLLTLHSSGLHVLPGVKHPQDVDQVTAQQISRLIALLKREFRYVVIDTAPGMTDQTLAALDHTTDLVLVTGLDVPSVRGLRKELEVLGELDLQPATRHIVANMADRHGGLSVADVEATINRKIDFVLPRSPKMARSTNLGSPLVESQPRDRLSRELLGLASRFAPGADASSSWRGRHRGRSER